ncbi:hypothetical protein VaNZ11_006049 [Volvox africanus]|uniref:PH domain-containing protein n=1 Tax=Volvox africanus TaxID=51714 RepID=A0ABQ5S1J9_9CHLO|nr:hypothetical protein VaNZ11_006049 [Volvox africanus]
MAPSKLPSPSTPGDAGHLAGQSQPSNQGVAPAVVPSRSSLGGAHPPQSSSPVALAETASPVGHGGGHSATPSSPPSLTKRSDSGGASAGAGVGSAGSAAAPAGAAAFYSGGESGQSGPHSGSNHQHDKYVKRASDSGGGSVGTGLGFRMSPSMPKGASISGAGPTLGATGGQSSGSFVSQQSSQQGQQQAAQGFTGRRLQQLGQRLNFGLNLGRKKQTTFAPGVTGGGGSGGSVQVSYPEDVSSAGGGGSSTIGVTVSAPAGAAPMATSFGSTGIATFGHGASAHSVGANGGGGGGGGKLTAEEFNPPNHPVNPFSYLATPFRVMARTKAGVAMGRYATTALRLKRDGLPPASYMWLWLGNFKRWHRRYFVASEAPGVLLIYKRANMKGKVWSTSLSDATVSQDDSHPRQIRLATPSGTIFLRVLRPEERQPWIACMRASQEVYRKHKEVVDTLTAAAGETGEAAGTVAGTLPSVASGAVEQDAEQRRRIRARLNDRLAELAPLVSEVERHLSLVGTHLAGAAAGIGHLSTPLAQYSSFSQINNRGLRSPVPGDSHAAAAAAASSTAVCAAAATAAAQAAAEGLPAAAGVDGSGGQSVAVLAQASVGAGASPRRGDMHVTTTTTAAPVTASLLQWTASEVADMAPHDRTGAAARSRSRSRVVPSSTPLHSPTLAGAVAALVDAFRATLHNEAVRIATLEAENAALNKTVNILRANTHRNAGRSRGASTPGLNATSAVAAGGGAAAGGTQAAHRASGSVAPAAAALAAQATATVTSGVMDDAASEGSACTADEDAFDVVESFDDGVDYSILDDDAPHLHRRLGVDDDLPPYVQHGNYPGVADEEESDEDAEEDAAELAQQAEVLNALEVVRQVEYITANDNNAQLKTLLTADTPPPPDAEEDEEEGGKQKLKSRAKGEDTDVTLDDEDDDDSETGAGGGGAEATRRPYAGRSRLPAPKPLGRGFSIWSILKNMIGRDLTKITMPATINEPLSMTQRMAEVLENRSLLERACSTADSVDRLMLVSCWLLAGYNSQPLRDSKPFNPLLGETFEWQAPDGTSRYLCEQVSHHPPVSCFVAEGAGPQGYELYGEVETKTKFWGKTIDCILAGHMSLKLKAFGEEYRFNLGTLVINDIILGRFWIDLSCDMKIRNQQTGDTARLVIKPCRGYLHLKERGKCEGVVCDAEGREVWRISGSSMGTLFAALTPEAAAARGQDSEPQLIWSKEPELPNPMEQYCMTRFALGLNDPADPVVPHLPPTDARFRPDMRALELGEWNRATSEKLRLEEKQRAVRRMRKEAGQDYQPKWFRQVLFNTKDATQAASQPGSVWEFTHEYWDARNRKDWGELPDIY